MNTPQQSLPLTSSSRGRGRSNFAKRGRTKAYSTKKVCKLCLLFCID